MRGWLESTIEWRSWGWNALTVSFVATVVFTVLQAWGLWKQHQTIRDRRSGQSISVLLFSYIGCVFFSLLAYGVVVRSVAAVCNGLLGVLHVLVVVDLWRFKGFTRGERILVAVFPLTIVAMIAVPWRSTLLLVVMGASLVPMAQQPYEMWRDKSAGALDLRYVAIFTASAVFWTIYAVAISSWVLAIINPSIAVILLATAALWRRYRQAATVDSTIPGEERRSRLKSIS